MRLSQVLELVLQPGLDDENYVDYYESSNESVEEDFINDVPENDDDPDYETDEEPTKKCGPVAEGVRRRTLASSLGPPQKSHHVDDAGSSPVRAEHSQATPRQTVHIG